MIARSLLFSIAHHALTNVMRHAKAGRATIELDCKGGELRLSVSDVKGGEKLGQRGGGKVYQQGPLASINVRTNGSGEMSF